MAMIIQPSNSVKSLHYLDKSSDVDGNGGSVKTGVYN